MSRNPYKTVTTAILRNHLKNLVMIEFTTFASSNPRLSQWYVLVWWCHYCLFCRCCCWPVAVSLLQNCTVSVCTKCYVLTGHCINAQIRVWMRVHEIMVTTATGHWQCRSYQLKPSDFSILPIFNTVHRALWSSYECSVLPYYPYLVHVQYILVVSWYIS